MSKAISEAVPSAWREGRRRAARSSIVEAAWALAREEGLSALSMRELARRAGVTTPTLYAYFESKNSIYDVMFGQAAAEFAEVMGAPFEFGSENPAKHLEEGLRRFVGFCTQDVVRYQLLFQRIIPGFEPSAESYAHAVESLDSTRRRLATIGITRPEHLDIWTALVTGLIDQQLSNDPGGDRWTRLTPQFVEMFLSHCRPPAGRAARNNKQPEGARR